MSSYLPPIQIAKTLIDMGCYGVSLADTIGVATPGAIKSMLTEVMKLVPANRLGIHCHDTYGQAIANIFAALQVGLVTLPGCHTNTALFVIMSQFTVHPQFI